MFKYKVSLFLLMLSLNVHASDRAIKDYKRELKKFRKLQCTSRDSRRFWDLTKKTNRGGFYVPTMHDGRLDIHTIQKMLPRVREKKQWIQKNISLIKKEKKFKALKEMYRSLQGDLKLLVGFKRKYQEEKSQGQRKAIKALSRQKLQDFYFDLREVFKKTYMLHTFSFPVDHKGMRRDYDSFKRRRDIAGKKRANEIFFIRKLVEDGVRHPRWRGSDRGIRTVINTVFTNSMNNHAASFIDEDVRYDLDWLLERIHGYLQFDKSLIKKRLQRWENYTDKMYRFYIGLLTGEVEVGGEAVKVDEFIDGKGRSRSALKEFVYKKQADAYEYWSKKKKLMRMMYVFDTIILNEVGGTSDPGDLEKKEVLKVVFNRTNLDYYSSLSVKDSISNFLLEKNINTKKFSWLNTLFKEGEFSFTYYFLTASNHVFCPDMSGRADKIRETALRLGLELMNEKKIDSEAVRYFSRISMLGRIDMTDLWTGFQSLPENPGNPVDDKNLKQKVRNREFEYLYKFTSSKRLDFRVVRISDNIYVLGKNNEVYEYRNPQNFRYFVEK